MLLTRDLSQPALENNKDNTEMRWAWSQRGLDMGQR